jgi:hypothetical protein
VFDVGKRHDDDRFYKICFYPGPFEEFYGQADALFFTMPASNLFYLFVAQTYF